MRGAKNRIVMDGHDTRTPNDIPPLFFLLLAAVIFLGFSILFLETQPHLYCDEAVSLLYAKMSWQRLFEVLLQDTHGPLHYILLKLWQITLPLPGVLLSWLAGVGTVALVYGIAGRLANERAALMAAFITATPCFHVAFSGWVRMYALSGFLAVAAAYYAIRFFQEPKRRQNGIGYALFATASLYAHYMAFPFLAALNIALLLAARLQGCKAANNEPPRPHAYSPTPILWLALQALPVLLFLPWVKVLVGQVKDVWSSFAFPPVTPASVLNVFHDFSLFVPSVHDARWHAVALNAAGTLVYGWLFLAGLWVVLGRAEGGARPFGLRSVPAVTLLVSLAIVYLISLRRPLFESRVLFLLCPFYYLVLAQSLEAHRPALRRLLLTAVLMLNVLSLGYYAFSPVYAKTAQWRKAAVYLKAHRHSTEPVLHTSVLSFPPLVYYLGGADGHKVIGLSFENATASTRFPLLISPKAALPDVDGFLQNVRSFWLIEETDWRPWIKQPRPYQHTVEDLAKKPGWSLRLVRAWRGVRLYKLQRSEE